LKDFFATLGRVLLYTLPCYLLIKRFPSLENGNLESLLCDLAMLAAVYPVARRLGFRLGAAKAYLEGFKTELRPAFKYFLITTALLIAGDYVYCMALAPWDLPWTNTLLFWNDMDNNPVTSGARIGAVLQNPLLLPGYLLTICVCAPLIEEFIMRRWLYVVMRGVMPMATALMLNGALFGLLHGKDFMATAMSGILLCWVYDRTGRLQTPILVHAFSNLFALFMLFGEKVFCG